MVVSPEGSSAQELVVRCSFVICLHLNATLDPLYGSTVINNREIYVTLHPFILRIRV